MLVSIPADPSRTFAVLLYRPGVGWWDWSTYLWQTALSAACLHPLAAAAGDVPGDRLIAYLPMPAWVGGEVALRVVALDAAGSPVETVLEEVLGPWGG